MTISQHINIHKFDFKNKINYILTSMRDAFIELMATLSKADYESLPSVQH